MPSIINVTTGTAGTQGSTAATLINELKGQMLNVAQYDDMLEQSLFVSDPVDGAAKTKQWNRMERLPVATTPSQLVEGVAADAVGVSINSVTATMEEYGNAIIISRLAAMTARNPIVQDTIRTLGYNVKETRDRLLYATANAGTNVFRVNDRANDDATAVGDYLSFEEVSQVGSSLDSAGAPKWPNGNYRLVSPINIYAKLQVDPNWLAAHQFSKPDQIERGYVGTLLGVDIIKTNSNSFAATASVTSGNASKIRSFFAAGPEWAKVTDLQATEMHIQAPGQGTDYQKRRYEMAWTCTFKSVITNQNFGLKGRCSCDDAVAV